MRGLVAGREFVAELLGTCVLIMFGCGSVAQSVNQNTHKIQTSKYQKKYKQNNNKTQTSKKLKHLRSNHVWLWHCRAVGGLHKLQRKKEINYVYK